MTLSELEDNLLVSVLFLEATVLLLIASFRYSDIPSTVMLLIFNFLFISLTFGLNGKINRKLGLLAFGNGVGLVWNISLNSLAITANALLGDAVLLPFQILHPLLNFFWLVSFWSLSLSALPKPRRNLERRNFDY
jgi:hypothetical protein